MDEKITTIYEFETKNFRLEVNALPEYGLDFSEWDENLKKEVLTKLDNATLCCFCVQALLIDKQTGQELASDYLGQCIYSDYQDFKDNLGINHKKSGSYFSDMIHTVLRDGRENYNNRNLVKLNH